jgi:hypothetical protein
MAQLTDTERDNVSRELIVLASLRSHFEPTLTNEENVLFGAALANIARELGLPEPQPDPDFNYDALTP